MSQKEGVAGTTVKDLLQKIELKKLKNLNTLRIILKIALIEAVLIEIPIGLIDLLKNIQRVT